MEIASLRLLSTALVAPFVISCAPPVNVATSVGSGSADVRVSASPLILAPTEGETRVRRFPGASTEFTIKVDERNGGSQNFLMLAENMPPGASIAPHRHLLSDEILFIHSGSGTVEVGDKRSAVGAGSTVYIPANTRITLRNTGNAPLAVVAVFARQGFEDYLRETSSLKGERFVPLTPSELAAMRKRAEHHTIYEQR